MQIVDLTELLLPDDLVVIEGALLFIRIEVQAEQRLDAFKEFRQRVHVELGGWLVHTLIIAVVFVLVAGVRARMHCFRLWSSKQTQVEQES